LELPRYCAHGIRRCTVYLPTLATIPEVLEKIACEWIRCMLVIHERTKGVVAVFEGMREHSCVFMEPINQFTEDILPMRWKTIFAVVDGRCGHMTAKSSAWLPNVVAAVAETEEPRGIVGLL